MRSVKTLNDLKKLKEKLIIIHYACTDVTISPTIITSISIKNYSNEQIQTFGMDSFKTEKKILIEFVKFLKKNTDKIFVTWNQKSNTYGFQHLEQRCKENDVVSSLPINQDQMTDLDNIFERQFGQKYAKHPKLRYLAELNDLTLMNFVDGENELSLYDKAEYRKIENSTNRKVAIISSLLTLSLDNKLKVDLVNYSENDLIQKKHDNLISSSTGINWVKWGAIFGGIAVVLIAISLMMPYINQHQNSDHTNFINTTSGEAIQSNGQAGGITAGQVIINNNIENNAISGKNISTTNLQTKSNDYTIHVNQQLTKGPFQILVTQVGLYTPDGYGNTIQYFRVDMQVKNIGNSTENFLTNPIAIVDDKGNQYEEIPLGSLFVGFDMFPKTVKNGTMLFQTIPDNIKNVKLVFHLHDEDYNPLNFQYNFSLK